MDKDNIQLLIEYGSTPGVLQAAQLIAGGIVDQDPYSIHNTCATTLSLLMNMAQIDVGIEPAVLTLVSTLRKRNWYAFHTPDTFNQTIGTELEICAGDVGVFVGSDKHHVYLVIDASDQSKPLIADNQAREPHDRPVRGDTDEDISQTTYFFRAT